MAFVGSLSGSLGTIAVTGSLIPGSATNDLGSSASKWQNVYASNITGSIRKTGAGDDFVKAGPNITANYNTLGQWEITGTSSGGAGAGVFTEASSNAAYTTSSIAIGYAGAATSVASDLFFYVSGSTDGTKNALFGGDVVTSGSVTVRDNTSAISIGYGPSTGVGQITSLNGNLVLDTVGGSRVIVDTDLEVAGNNIYAGGGGTVAKNIFTDITNPAYPISIGGTGSKTATSGTLQVIGNQISGSAGGNIALGAAGAVTVAGNLTVNGGLTGSLQKTTGGQDFIKAGPNVTANYNTLGQWEITGTSASTEQIFSSLSSTTAFTTSSISIGFNAAASTKGSDVFFAVSGSNESSNTALFSGPIVTSGSFTVKDLANGNTVASITGVGVISGSGLQTVGNLAVQGTSALIGNVTVTGDVAVNGGDITTSAGTFNIAASATTVNVGSSAGKVVIPGDLEVQGTTITVDVTNITIEDPLIGLGFTTGSTAGTAGDRGFIGGITGAGNNVAWAWSNANSAFVATKTTSAPGNTTLAVSALQPIRASSFQVGGTTAIVTSSDGNSLMVGSNSTTTLSGSSVVLNASSTGVAIQRDGTLVGSLKINGGLNTLTVVSADSTGASKALMLTGSSVTIGANSTNVDFAFAGTSLGVASPVSTTGFNIGSATGKNLTVSGSGDFSLLHSSTGLQLVQNLGQPTYLTFNKNGSNAQLAAQAGLILSGTSVALSGSTVNFVKDGTSVAYVGASTDASPLTGLFPSADSTYHLGSPALRWAHIYTGDLHLRNERGDYTLIEESDFLSVRFNKTGKRYKFLLERVPELDE